MTHTPKTTAESLRAFVEASAAALGLAPLQPWQIRLLDAIGIKGRRRGLTAAEWLKALEKIPPARSRVWSLEELYGRRGRVMILDDLPAAPLSSRDFYRLPDEAPIWIGVDYGSEPDRAVEWPRVCPPMSYAISPEALALALAQAGSVDRPAPRADQDSAADPEPGS